MKICARGLLLPLAALFFLVSIPAIAHHGPAEYDTTTQTALKGTITDFQFMNPHSVIFFDVKDAAGNVQKWSAEALSATSMVRQGWSKTMMKPGDQVTIIGNISKNGSHAMRLNKIVLASGKEMAIEY
jgi:hypothetical protein